MDFRYKVILLLLGQFCNMPCFAVKTKNEQVWIEAKFLASNVIKTWVCVTSQKQSQSKVFELDNFILSTEEGEVKYEKVKTTLDNEHHEQYCESHLLWFEDTVQWKAVNMTVEVSVVLVNSSKLLRTGVVSLSRAAQQAPIIKNVEVCRYDEVCDDIPGPFYSSVVPSPIPMDDPKYKDIVIMKCNVQGFPSPRVRWLRDGVYVSDSGDYNTSLAGHYKCEVDNQYGRSYSHVIQLKHAYMGSFPTMAENPVEITVLSGSHAELKCTAKPSCFPTCQVSWWRETRKNMPRKRQVQIDNNRLFITEEGSLVIRETEVTDSYYYVCAVKEHLVMYTKKYGAFTKLTVNNRNGTDNRATDLTLVYRSKTTHVGVTGQHYRMLCVFHGQGLSVLWYKAGSEDSPISSTTSLNFTKITKEDAGTYYCQAHDSYGSLTDKYHFMLKVESVPVINSGLGLKWINATRGSDLVVDCATSGIPQPSVTFTVNGQTIDLNSSHYRSERGQLKVTGVGHNNSGVISCNASNSLGYALSSTCIHVSDPTVILSNFSDINIGNNSTSALHILCDASTDPNTILKVTWYKDGYVLPSRTEYGVSVKRGVLTLHTQVKHKNRLNGRYECVATNTFTTTKKGFNVFPFKKEVIFVQHGNVKSSSSDGLNSNLVIVCAGIVGSVLVVVAILILIYKSCGRKKYSSVPRSRLSTLSDATVSTLPFTEADQMVHSATVFENRQLSVDKSDTWEYMPVKDPNLRSTISEVYIDRDRIKMDELIGKGQFGRVYLAVLNNEKGTEHKKVAVKTLKYKADETDIVNHFLQEAIIMKNFTHPHVLSLTGISFELDESPMVVLPYMSNGDLRNYIQDPEKDITVLELLKLGLQVARGMSYLSQRKYVHRDLACRNCMVDDTNTVKVADFGLSRDLFSRDYYREASGKRPLPVRWMAPECHKINMFTTHSDVWSFGILLWELMTRGAVPYPNIENWNVSGHVAAGNKLPQPNYCPSSVYKIMLDCWEIPDTNRPPFLQLVQDIEDIVLSANSMESEDAETFYMNIQRTEEPDYRYNNNNNTTVV